MVTRLVLGFLILVAIEGLTLFSFTIIYLAGKGLWLILGVLFLLSSLAYAATAAGLKAFLDRLPSRRNVSLLVSLLIAGVLHSIVLYLVMKSYWEGLKVWETLGIILSVSNIYGFVAVYPEDLAINNVSTYSIVDAVTLTVIPWLSLNFYWARRGRLRGLFDYFKGISISTALAVKPVKYLLLIVWIITLAS